MPSEISGRTMHSWKTIWAEDAFIYALTGWACYLRKGLSDVFTTDIFYQLEDSGNQRAGLCQDRCPKGGRRGAAWVQGCHQGAARL